MSMQVDSSAKRVGRVVSISFPPDGRTKQSFKAQCDINSIVAKARVSGFVSHLASRRPIYGDFSSIPDYQSALAVVISANSSFESLPSNVRERFSNDPGKMISFLADPANLDESYKLGLRVKPVVKPDPVVKVKVVDDDPPKPPIPKA